MLGQGVRFGREGDLLWFALMRRSQWRIAKKLLSEPHRFSSENGPRCALRRRASLRPISDSAAIGCRVNLPLSARRVKLEVHVGRNYNGRRYTEPSSQRELELPQRPGLVVRDALTAIGVAALLIGAYRLMGTLGELIAFSGAMGQ
jgi:hypothetical protein